MQQAIIIAIDFIYGDDRDYPPGGPRGGIPFTRQGYAAYVWNEDNTVGTKLFSSPGAREYVENWLISCGYRGCADGIYRK